MSFPAGETVRFISGGARVDRGSGETVYDDWASPVVEATYDGVGVEDTQTSEVATDGREQVIQGRTLYFWQEVVPISREWRVLVRGDTMRVHGRPAHQVNPFTGWRAGTVVELRWADG